MTTVHIWIFPFPGLQRKLPKLMACAPYANSSFPYRKSGETLLGILLGLLKHQVEIQVPAADPQNLQTLLTFGVE